MRTQHEFIQLGSIRVAEQTQLPFLAAAIKNRSFNMDSLISDLSEECLQNSEYYAKMLVLLNAAADFKSYKKIVQEIFEVETYLHTEESML
jgi:hypothetical protein